MKTTLTVARILTWFNLIVWIGFLAILFLAVLAMQAYALLVIVFLFCAMPLHSYAALKLQKSIRFPAIRLSNQTPVGIRFIGIIALFFGFTMLANSYFTLQNPVKTLELMKEGMAEAKGVTNAQLMGYIRGGAVFGVILGLCVIVSVVLNMRLLRWYYLVKQSDVS